MKMKLPKISYNFKLSANLALITGLMMGILAAAAQGFFEVQPPVGQGVCAITHPSNLVNWLVNNIFGTEFTIHGIFVAVPVLTPVGWIIGSFIAALKNKEFQIRRGPVRENLLAFIFGFLIVNLALLWGSCPIRTAVLASYGWVFAIIILATIVIGVILACEYIKWKVRRM
ncbi:MAG: cytochrome C [Dehalococcoidia bacterium]|nr:MAG: cytochrome C [Dehalococcoidia bacterium]